MTTSPSPMTCVRCSPGSGPCCGAARRGSTQSSLDLGDFRINFDLREVRLDDNTVVQLTRKEFDLLALLVQRRGTVVSRERILHEVWGTTWKGLERSLEVHVAGLRRKLGERDVIRTVRGVGYHLDVTERGD